MSLLLLDDVVEELSNFFHFLTIDLLKELTSLLSKAFLVLLTVIPMCVDVNKSKVIGIDSNVLNNSRALLASLAGAAFSRSFLIFKTSSIVKRPFKMWLCWAPDWATKQGCCC